MNTKRVLFTLMMIAATARGLQAQDAPAVQRLKQMIDVVATGDTAAMRAFVETAYHPSFRGIAPMGRHVEYLAAMKLKGAGRPDAPVATGATTAGAIARNPLTEEIDSMTLQVDTAADHRIVRVNYRGGAGGSLAAAQPRTDAERAKELARYVKKLADAGEFSGVVLFAHNGVPLYYDAFGIANRDFNVPVNKQTKFNLGSANKNFTAVVIGQLVEEGKLSWDDPLSKFIPDFPDSASAGKIRIKHLLSHTAGLGSYFNKKFVESSRALWRNVDDLMRLATPDRMRFEPGTDFSYSNTGYLVLGKVIEVVEGRDYYDVVRDRIYRPLGMTSTDAYELDHVNPNLALGYARQLTADGILYKNNLFDHVIRGGPAGGGYSNAEDLLKYAEALRTGKIIKRSTLELMRSPKPELNAPRYGYGFALFDAPNIWGHGGDFPGVDFDLQQYGDTGYTLIVMANFDRVNEPILNKVKGMIATEIATAR